MTLAQWAVGVGCLIMLVNLPAFLVPGKFLQVVYKFPRSTWPAWVLTAVDLVWVAWMVHHANLGRFEYLKPFIYPAAPVAFGLIVFFMNELLAPRALGGLLMLAACPILHAARWEATDWRYVMTVLAYVWAVAGMVLMLSPFRFRQAVQWVNRSDALCRWLAVPRLALGGLVLFLGLAVY